ncbi:MAG: NADPH-dependent glutamate synthase [Ruminococcaceae bacterium]|nr:NADPH-dependent glutamate synthase [Oscillospiraceae bacterium]
MANMSPNKVKMKEQDPQVRNQNFLEVSLGYTPEEAMEEAQRCLNCKNPMCVKGCPVNVQIPDFIARIVQGDFAGAYHKITETNSFPAVCGRVCPQENQCEGKCVRAIKGESVGIGRLERFAADWYRENGDTPKVEIAKKGKKAAVVGAGPASLACAGDLAKRGYDVTVFEAFHTPGGVLMYGIPEFRLPKEIVRKEIEGLEALGVEIRRDMVIGKILSIDELRADGYETVFIGTGAGLPRFMGIEGESLNGVYSANEFLTRINLMKAYQFPEYDTPIEVGRNVAVIGGGNVAMDAARSAKRLGAENVYIVYRRSEEEMPARLEEVHHAKEEGIIFRVLENPTRILGEDGWVTGMECVSMELGEPDESGRRRPVEKAGSEHVLDVQTVIVAVGQSPNPLIKATTKDLQTQKWGGIVADETGATSIPGVYAGGDAVTGAATVILAMGAGKRAAAAMDEYMSKDHQ